MSQLRSIISIEYYMNKKTDNKLSTGHLNIHVSLNATHFHDVDGDLFDNNVGKILELSKNQTMIL